MFTFTKERELEGYIIDNFDTFFPFDFYCSQLGIWGQRRVDIVGKDADNNYYLVEVKRDIVTKSAIKQVCDYVPLFKISHSHWRLNNVYKIVVAPFCCPQVRNYAESLGVTVKTIEDVLFVDKRGDILSAVELDDVVLSKIDNYGILKHRRRITRSEAIRQLIKLGLAARK